MIAVIDWTELGVGVLSLCGAVSVEYIRRSNRTTRRENEEQHARGRALLEDVAGAVARIDERTEHQGKALELLDAKSDKHGEELARHGERLAEHGRRITAIENAGVPAGRSTTP